VAASRESLDGTEMASAVDLLDSAGRVARRVAFLPRAGGLEASASHAGVFVQDSWTATPWLTLDAGVRDDQSSGTKPAIAPRLAWIAKLPLGDTTLGGSVGRFSDKLPLEVYGFATEQPRLVETLDAAGGVASAILYSNRTAGRLDIPTATRWEVELAHRFSGGWQGRLKYQERHGRHELTVEPVLGSPGSGTLLLDSAGRSDARSLELTAAYRAPGAGHELYLSYVRSATSGSVNTLSAIDGAFGTPYVQPDQIAPLTADVPHRFVGWGLARLPSRITVAPFFEVRSGFPYSPVDDTWNYAGAANSARLPWFASLDLYVNKVFSISPRLPDARIGIKLYNILSVHTERDVQRDVARPDYGQTFDTIPRDFTLVFELLWGKGTK
jgi:outer membrane receptor protein involved in Fe transport